MAFSLFNRLEALLEKLFSDDDSPGGHDGDPAPKPGETTLAQKKYAPIREAVQRKLAHLKDHEIPEHREFADDDMLELQYVEIEAAPAGKALLDEFFAEFTHEARLRWIHQCLGPDVPVRLDYPTQVIRSTEMPAEARLDPHLHILNRSNTDSGGAEIYRVRLWKKWRQPSAQTEPPASPPPAQTRGPAVVVRIHDAHGQRPDIRRETYPIKLGKLADIPVDGTFVSGDHCVLHCRNGHVELEDASKNGTWVDGIRLHRQRQRLTQGKHRLKLGKIHGEAKDCPDIELDILAETTTTPVADVTPLETCAATPIAAEPQALLAVLSAQDATGNPLIDVVRLPFTIGRGKDSDYATPPGHAGVSSQHLAIEAVDEQGAQVLNEAHAKNGTALAGVLQGERFLWPYGEEVTLAPKWKNHPAVSILLKHP